jgi:outer membrane receptor protein involved in Fe transport
LRLDAYQRTDARINKVWPRDKWRITLYGEVVNLTNRTNYRWDSYNSYNSRTGQVSLTLDKMFPILPAAGITIER